MTILFYWILSTVIWVLAIKISTSDDMVFERLRKWAEDVEERYNTKWMDPVVLCEWCLPSVHSFFTYGLLWGAGVVHEFSWHHLAIYPLVVGGSSFCSGMLWLGYLTLNRIKEYYEHAERLAYYDKRDRQEQHHIKKSKEKK